MKFKRQHCSVSVPFRRSMCHRDSFFSRATNRLTILDLCTRRNQVMHDRVTQVENFFCRLIAAFDFHFELVERIEACREEAE